MSDVPRIYRGTPQPLSYSDLVGIIKLDEEISPYEWSLNDGDILCHAILDLRLSPDEPEDHEIYQVITQPDIVGIEQAKNDCNNAVAEAGLGKEDKERYAGWVGATDLWFCRKYKKEPVNDVFSYQRESSSLLGEKYVIDVLGPMFEQSALDAYELVGDNPEYPEPEPGTIVTPWWDKDGDEKIELCSFDQIKRIREILGSERTHDIVIDDYVVPCVNSNDVFWWGCADSDMIEPGDIDDLERAINECKEVGSPSFGSMVWAGRKRGMRPQGAWYPKDDKSVWPLIDSCGPERETDIGNPYAPGTYVRS